jgi:bacterioferritin
MKGNEHVLAELNAALSAELTAIAQYIVHAEMCHNWGYKRLGDFIHKQAIDEMRHAEGLIERILFLDGTPKISIQLDPKIGAAVPEQVANDLAAELTAVKQYNNSAAVSAGAGDNGTRELFERMTKDEEQHVDFLEAQQHLMKEMGVANYLAQQMHGPQA